ALGGGQAQRAREPLLAGVHGAAVDVGVVEADDPRGARGVIQLAHLGIRLPGDAHHAGDDRGRLSGAERDCPHASSWLSFHATARGVLGPCARDQTSTAPLPGTDANVAFMTAPIDATTTSAWAELSSLREGFSPDLRGWFASDPERARRLSLPLADLHVDLSKNLVTDDILAALVRLAEQTGVAERYAAMLAGEHINTTEDRAVLHTALRRPADASPALVVDGQDIDRDVQEVLDALSAFSERVRSGDWVGVTGKRVTHVVNIGIGGSDLGPVMVYEALKPYADAGI